MDSPELDPRIQVSWEIIIFIVVVVVVVLRLLTQVFSFT